MWVVVRIRFDKMFGKKVLVPTIYVGCSKEKLLMLEHLNLVF